MLFFRSLKRSKTISILYNTIMSFHCENSKIVAVCQMTCSDDKDQNYNHVVNLIKGAKRQNASMVFFPEACDYICRNTTDVPKLAETLDGNLITNYRTLARDNTIWLSIGVHLKFSDAKVKNSLLLINNDGVIVGKYDKLHTFSAQLLDHSLDEANWTAKGDKLIPPIETPIGKVGLSVCYDVRFPEIGIALTQMGAEILTYPSAFTFETGSLHWETLMRARAIENQCYVIAAAQTGFNTPNRRAWGHAMVVDPSGIITAQCSNDIGLAVAAIDLSLVKKVRAAMQLQSQRRFDIYPKLANFAVSNIPSYQFGQVVISSDMVFYKTDYTIAFVNKRCAVPGHVLVTPIRVSKRLSELTAVEVSDLFQTVQKVQSVMEKVHDTKSSTIVIQDGPEAGQTIWHVHVHILPRKPNDFPDNDDVYRVLQKHNEVSGWRDQDDMIKEAQFLKPLFQGI